MEDRKELITWGVVVLIVAVFIWQMPNLERFVFGGSKKNTTKPKVEEKVPVKEEKIPTKYTCTLIDDSKSEEGYISTTTLVANFDKKGEANSYTETITSKYTNEEAYKTLKSKDQTELTETLTKYNTVTGIEFTYTLDDDTISEITKMAVTDLDEAIESAKSKEVAITFKLDDTNRNYKKLSAKMKTDGYNCSINY